MAYFRPPPWYLENQNGMVTKLCKIIDKVLQILQIFKAKKHKIVTLLFADVNIFNETRQFFSIFMEKLISSAENW